MSLRFLSLSAYARTEFEPVASPQAGRHTTPHDLPHPDNRVFDVRRLRFDGCGRGCRDVVEREAAFGPTTLH